jgi:LCP family protein required for cell wall assembly
VNDQRDGDEPRPGDPVTPPTAGPPGAEPPPGDGPGGQPRSDGEPPEDADEGSSLFGPDDDSDAEEPRRGLFGRHKALTILGGLALVLVLALIGGALYVNHMLFGDIDRIDAFGSIDESARPEPVEGGALTILLAGADNGDTESMTIEEAMDNSDWSAGLYRSDTIMVLHIPEDRSRAYVVSIPRDSYVRIYDETGEYTEKHKVNYAFSVYGPAGYISTIEHLTDVRMDHLAIIDWAGFRDVVDALGGVRLYVPQTIRDTSQNYTYRQGWNEYDGELALKYVRSRYPLDEGDFDRNRRQQNFLRAMLDQMAQQGALTDFPTFLSAAKSITSNLTIDQEWSNGDMRSLGWSMRGIRKDDVTFLSAPINQRRPFGNVPGDGSVVYLDKRGVEDLFGAMRADDMQTFVNDHPELTLPGETEVD